MIKWKYNIGDRIVNHDDDNNIIKRDLTITDKKIITKQLKNQILNEKWYKYICNICGWNNGWKSESKLYHRESGCQCCQNQIVVKGINDLATTNPEFVKYFDNINDTYVHTKASNKKVNLHCPSCNYHKIMTVHTLYQQGFSCPICEDGYSYPEKLLHIILQELNIDYIFQLTKKYFSWCGKYRYDFYLPKYNCIIEVHGSQHYDNIFINGRSQSEEFNNDKNKKVLALNNNIQHYIIIDARKSDLLYIKQSILNSKLVDFLDLSNLNWNLCGEKASSSLVIDVCKYYESHKNNNDFTIKEISTYFNISRSCIIKYLKKGNTIGLCDYNEKEMQRKTGLKNGKNNMKDIYVYDINNNFICKHKGIYDLTIHSKELLGVNLDRNKITQVCNGKIDSYKGYKFSFHNLN